jgi:hypothetical protein
MILYMVWRALCSLDFFWDKCGLCPAHPRTMELMGIYNHHDFLKGLRCEKKRLQKPPWTTRTLGWHCCVEANWPAIGV